MYPSMKYPKLVSTNNRGKMTFDDGSERVPGCSYPGDKVCERCWIVHWGQRVEEVGDVCTCGTRFSEKKLGWVAVTL